MIITPEQARLSIDMDINKLIKILQEKKMKGYSEIHFYMHDAEFKPGKVTEIDETNIEGTNQTILTLTISTN